MSTKFKLVTGKFNHRPEPVYQGIWYLYTGARLKDYYDIKLHDGTVLRAYYPNADSWNPRGNDNDGRYITYYDKDVAEVRLIPDDELKDLCKYAMLGHDRLDRNIRYFGDLLPRIITHDDGTTSLEPIVKRVFENPVISSWTGEQDLWLHTNELSMDELSECMTFGDYDKEGFVTSLIQYAKRAGINQADYLNGSLNQYIDLYGDALVAHEEIRIRLEEEQRKQEARDRLLRRSGGRGIRGASRVNLDDVSVNEELRAKKPKDGLTGKQRRKLEKKQRRLDRETIHMG